MTIRRDAPPTFLQLTGHPVRWQLLRALAHSDQRVNELSAAVGRAQNAISYHLSRLRAGGLVSVHRSSADGRDSYYRIEMTHCREQLAAAGAALHPGLVPHLPPGPIRRGQGAPVPVLFLCTGNSARSQIAEALLRHGGGDRFAPQSAGSHPKPLHPNAVRVMREYGIDISDQRTKHLDEVGSERFQVVITLCDKVREICPDFPGRPDSIHWSIPDPAAAGGRSAASYSAFQRTAEDLHTRIGFLIDHLDDTGQRVSA